jgi:outer membrane protein TolC
VTGPSHSPIAAAAGRLTLAALLVAGGAGCASRVAPTLKPPGPVPASPAAPAEVAPLPPAATQPPQIPPELIRPGATFTLADVVNIALANNPLTRASYFAARAAAAFAGVRRAPYYPFVDLAGTFTTSQTSTGDGRQNDPTGVGAASLNLTYLLFDFGGRKASAEDAYWGLVAADWAHNANIQNTVFNVQAAYFQYLNTRGQLQAARASLESSQRNYDAATGRHDAGVATIADVLQAKTALSQAELNVQLLEGQVQVFRGSLATAMGLPANIPLDVGELPAELDMSRTQAPVSSLIETALLRRPELSTARALVERAARRIEVARSDSMPSVYVSGSVIPSLYAPGDVANYQTNWTTRVLVNVPLFTGYARSYELLRTTEELSQARAQAETLEQQAILQVWTSYYALETATRRVATSRDLLASAEQSERVAFARYKEGVGTILDLLVTQAALANARATEVQARTDWLVSVARLARDTGAAAPLEQRLELRQKP